MLESWDFETRKEVLLFAMRVFGGIYIRRNRRMKMRYRLYLQHLHIHDREKKAEPKSTIARRPVTRSVTAQKTIANPHSTRSVTAHKRTACRHPEVKILPSVSVPSDFWKKYSCKHCKEFLRFLQREKERNEKETPVLEQVANALHLVGPNRLVHF